ncbi:MAG: hypothetical protein RL095_1090 [Verrucomicrobiota bacterium]|jgi:type IV pilus assembly protein PilM
MASVDLLLAIDVGSSSLKIGEFEISPSNVTLRKFGIAEYESQTSEENRIEEVTRAIQRLKETVGFTAKKAHVVLSAQVSFTKFVKLPPVGNDPVKIKQVVEYEAKQNVPFEMNEVIWDYQLIGNPNEELDVMFVAVKSDIVEKINSAVEAAGLRVDIIDIATSSCYNAARASRIGDDNCAMILNIGSRCSNLIFCDGQHFFSRNIPIAGFAITQQIAKEFGIGLDEAEELKRRHGFVALGGAYEEPESEVAATISKIVRNVMTRLHGEISRSINIYKTQQKGNKPVKLYLTGGSSTMAFTETFFQDKLKVDVAYLNPFQSSIVRLAPTIERQSLAEKAHLYSEVVGVALRTVECPVEISLLSEKSKRDKEVQGKLPYYYISAAIFAFIPVVFLLAGMKQQSQLESNIAENEQKCSTFTRRMTQINDGYNLIASTEKNMQCYSELARQRSEWITVLNEIEAAIPSRLMWMVSIKPIIGEPKPIVGSAPSKKSLKKGVGKAAETDQVGGLTVSGYWINMDDKIDDVSSVKIMTDVFKDNAVNKKDSPFINDRGEASKPLTGSVGGDRSSYSPAPDQKLNLNSFEVQLALETSIGRVEK